MNIKKFFILVLSVFFVSFPLHSSANDSEVTQNSVFNLVNAERVQSGFPPLTYNIALAQAAQNKAEDMVAQNYFEHTSPSGKEFFTWIQEAGYKYKRAGENLAMNAGSFSSAFILKNWMDSLGHRANILADYYTETGIGVAYGVYEGMPAVYVVQMFGAPNTGSLATPSSSAVSETHANLAGVSLPVQSIPRPSAKPSTKLAAGVTLIKDEAYKKLAPATTTKAVVLGGRAIPEEVPETTLSDGLSFRSGLIFASLLPVILLWWTIVSA